MQPPTFQPEPSAESYRLLSEGKRVEELVRATNLLLRLAAEKSTCQEYLEVVVDRLQTWTRCRCAGVRVIDKQGRIPYGAFAGFTQEFWERENGVLLGRDQCVCTRVMLGRPIPQEAPAMTPAGSFRTCRLSDFAKTLSAADQGLFRGVCVRSEFESVAVIPARHHGGVLGVIHLADRAPDRLPLPVVEFIEALAPLIGAALHQLELARALRESEERYRRLFEAESDAILVADQATEQFIDANPSALELYGYSRMELLSLKASDLSVEPAKTSQAVATGEVLVPLRWHRKKDGTIFPVEIAGNYFEAQGRRVHVAAIRDMTVRKELEEERELTINLLSLINTSADFEELMRKAIHLLRAASGCEAVGIRVRDGEDFPCFQTVGFPEKFVQAENRLCATDAEGKPRRDPQGHPVLECMCGNILRGRADPAKPFFTERGSFWTNSTSKLLAGTTEAERLARTRNRCHGEGYESVALIRMRSGGETFGLLQFNDPRPGRFTAEKIARLERVADNLASAVAQWQAQQARRRSDESLRMAAESAGFGTYAYDFQSGVGHWSPEFKALLGLKPAAALPLDADQLYAGLHPADRATFLAAMTAANDPRGNGLLQLDYRVLHPDGSVRWLQVRGLSTFVGEGANRRPERAAGVVLDITKRKRAEEALRKHQALLNQVQEITKVGGWEYDVPANRVSWTEEVYRLHEVSNDYDPSDASKDLEFYAPEDRPRVAAAFWRAVEHGEAFDLEPRLITARGRHLRVRIVGRAEFQDGRPMRIFGNILDITERKQAEEELRASREQLRALAARVQVVREEERTRVAREIHDVLAQELTSLRFGISLLARLLAQPASQPRRAQVREKLADMSARTDAAIGCVQRIATDLRPMVLDSLGLCAAIEWQAKDFQARTGIRCPVCLPADDPSLDRNLSTALFRILQESLTNVARHAAATCADISLRQEPGYIILTIQDNGRGIPAAQVDAPDAVGLLGMRERALLLGGRCDIAGLPGEGTRVEVRLPFSAKGEAEDAPS